MRKFKPCNYLLSRHFTHANHGYRGKLDYILYGIKTKAAISFPFNLHYKANSCLVLYSVSSSYLRTFRKLAKHFLPILVSHLYLFFNSLINSQINVRKGLFSPFLPQGFTNSHTPSYCYNMSEYITNSSPLILN